MNLVGKAYSSISLADLCTLLGQTEQEVKLGEYVYFMCYLWACFFILYIYIYLCVYLTPGLRKTRGNLDYFGDIQKLKNSL